MRTILTLSIFAACTFSCHIIRSSAPAPSINVMTFNIRYNNPDDGENAWPNRKDLVANMVRFHKVDLLGVQEALKGQMDDLSQLLPEFGWIGVGRDDGKEKGEYSSILYRKERFALLQQRTFWLSKTPEQAGSVGWDAAITRICTWGKFKDKATGKLFFLFNTHFDHIGETARIESAKLIMQNLQSLPTAEPIILIGDFNAPATSMVYEILAHGGPARENQNQILKDTREVSLLPHYGPVGTFHGFGKAAERPGIDYIFVNQRCKVLRHGTISDDRHDRYASDHFPVLAELILN